MSSQDKLKDIAANHRLCHGDFFVTEKMKKVFGKYISGVEDRSDTPPSLIVDYDNFRVIQESEK